jgi:hypothetical protein
MNTAVFKLKTRWRQDIFSCVLSDRSPAIYDRESHSPFFFIYRTERKNSVGIQDANKNKDEKEPISVPEFFTDHQHLIEVNKCRRSLCKVVSY